MTVKPVWIALVLGAAVWGCQKETGGTTSPQPALAGLRYFDAVLDTGYMDFRVVDIVEFAPNANQAQFRSGGNPEGVTNGFLTPPYQPVLAGAHDVRVFLNGLSLATDTTQMFDTTITFKQGWNYTFILYGSARAKALHSMVFADTAMALPADNGVWVRTVNLALDTTGVGPSVDMFATNYHNTPAGTPTSSATTYAKSTAYVRVPVDSLAAEITRTGTLTPVVASGNFPFGIVGTSSSNPIAGSIVKNTAFTIVVLPRSTPGAGMPNAYANPGVFVLVDQQPPLTAP